VSDTPAAHWDDSQRAEYLVAVPLSREGRDRLDRLIALGESKRSPFDGRPSKLAEVFRFDPKPRSFAPPVQRPHGRLVAMLAVFLIVVASVAALAQRDSPQAAQANLVNAILPVSDDLPIATGAGGTGSISSALNNGSPSALTPAPAGAFATPAPAAVANEPALTPHEVFGFAP
jgi:hypothetical protein